MDKSGEGRKIDQMRMNGKRVRKRIEDRLERGGILEEEKMGIEQKRREGRKKNRRRG